MQRAVMPTPKVQWQSDVCLLILLLAASPRLLKRAGRYDLGMFPVGKWMGLSTFLYADQPSVSNEWAGGETLCPFMQNFRYHHKINCVKCAVGIEKLIMSLQWRVMNTTHTQNVAANQTLHLHFVFASLFLHRGMKTEALITYLYCFRSCNSFTSHSSAGNYCLVVM